MIIRQEFSSLREGLVGAWCPSLGASGLSLIDRSGQNNHGVLTNMAGQDNWRASGSGVSLSFDGTNDNASVSHSQPLNIFGQNKTISVAAWINFTASTEAYNSVVSKEIVNVGNGYALLIKSNLRLAAYLTNSLGSNVSVDGLGSSIVAGRWTHIAFTYNGATIQTHIDGVLDSSAAGTLNWGGNTDNLLIGRSLQGSGRYLSAQLDDIRIYNRALSAPEVRLLASRRGIGLVPMPDRAAGLPRKLFVNDAGMWRNGDAYVNTGSGWRLGVPFVNDAGTWR